jgi:hypothetical protein
MEPVNSPEEPKPAMPRPTINIVDDCAAPQRAEPSSKMKKNTRKVHCMRVSSRRIQTFFVVVMGDHWNSHAFRGKYL